MMENYFTFLNSFFFQGRYVVMWSSVLFLQLLILFTCSYGLFPPTADTDFNVEAVVFQVLGFKC